MLKSETQKLKQCLCPAQLYIVSMLCHYSIYVAVQTNFKQVVANVKLCENASPLPHCYIKHALSLTV